MDKKEDDKITAFDTLFTNNHIQMLKIVMPYFDDQLQKKLAIYIKYLEFQYTLSYYNSHPFDLCGCSIQKEEFDIGKICSEVLPYCTKEEKEKIEQISGMFRSMEMYKEMSKSFEMMKDLFPEGFGDASPFGMPQDGAGNTDGAADNHMGGGMLDMLMNMLSPEQKSMFEMFGGNNNESK